MKRWILLVIGLTTLLIVGCGKTNKNTSEVGSEQQNVTENQQQQSVDNQNSEVTIEELQSFQYRLGYGYSGLYTFYNEDMLFGYMDSDGKILCEPKYSQICGYSEDLLLVVDTDNKWYYTNLDGSKTISEVDGMNIVEGRSFIDGYGIVDVIDSSDIKCSVVIDKDGKTVLKSAEGNRLQLNDKNYVEFDYEGKIVTAYHANFTEFTDAELQEKENYNNDEILEKNGIYMVVDYDGLKIYDNETKTVNQQLTGIVKGAERVDENYLINRYDENRPDGMSYSVVDKVGNEIYNISDNYSNSFTPKIINDKIALVFTNGENVKIIKEDGELYAELDGDDAFKSPAGTIIYGRKGKWGFLNEEFEEILPPKYNQVTEIFDNIGFALEGNVLYKVTVSK